MTKPSEKRIKRQRRRLSIRPKVQGTAKKPRLAVYRSLKHIYAQLIDDVKGVSLASASDLKLDKKTRKAESQLKAREKIAFAVGELLAEEAAKKKITKVVFDRGGFKYHGRVKALAEGARKGGLKF